jgi:TonB family protein
MKRFLMLAAAVALQSCSSSYSLLAQVIDGRLAFVPEDGREKCISVVRVMDHGPRAPDPAIDAISDPVTRADAMTRARTAWAADGVSFSCKAPFPIFYGAALPDMPVTVPPRKLRVGVNYSVSVMGPQGALGDGCFRMTREGRALNLAAHRCEDDEPSAATAAPASPPPRATVAPGRTPDLQALIGPDDYPEPARSLGEQGRVSFILDVGADGRVTRCTISYSSGSASLDSATCRLMRSRGRFTPARDANGDPATSRIDSEVLWILPGRPPPPERPKLPPQPGGIVVRHLAPPPVIVGKSDPRMHEPIMAIPQEGPGPAELSVWTPGRSEIPTLGKYDSIPECRTAKARLKLKPGQKAYCTLAPKRYRDWGIH